MQNNHNHTSSNIEPMSGQPGQPARKMTLFTLLVSVLILSACADHARRSTGTVINDQSLEFSIINQIYSHPSFSDSDHIKVEVHEGVVLLAGETVSEENRELATQLAEEQRLTKRVVNDLIIGQQVSVGGMLDNSWLSTKVNTILLTKNPLEGNDASRIKVVSSKNTVYLMGLVTHEEGDEITEIVRNIGGVEKVVKIFEYTD